MREQDQNISGDEEFDNGHDFELPKSTRLLIGIPILLLILSLLMIYIYLILCDPGYIDPAKYGLPSILISSIAILFATNIPWNKLGFRIKKIGMIELEQVVKGQAKNNSKELADLQKQIDDLKTKLQSNETVNATVNDLFEDNPLDQLIIKFLSQYNQWAFSALRIKKWGAQRTGFEEFNEYGLDDIRECLRRLLSKGQVVTRISKKGNTIYRIK
jgi:hypothetical protein